MPPDEERNDARNTEEPEPLEEREEIIDESSPEDDVEAGDSVFAREPSAPLDESAASNVPASSSATSASDLSEEESESEPTLDAPQENAASGTDSPMEPASNVLEINLPAGVYVPPARPSEAFRDRRSYYLPLNAGDALDDEADPVDQIFPPELRMPLHRRGSGAVPHSPEPAPRGDSSHTLPRVQVMVTLADARALFEEVLEEATESTAPKFQDLAKREVKQAAWERGCDERAADYRLRGPSW